MKDKIVVVGGGEHAHVVINLLNNLNSYEIIGYTDIKDKGLIFNAKYLGCDEVLKEIIIKFPNCKAVIGIGQIKISTIRNRIYRLLKDLGYELPTLISKNAIINEDDKIGEGSIVLDNTLINTNTQVGKCALIYSNAIIEHDCIVGDFVTFNTGSILAAGSTIGDNSILSVGAIVVSHKTVCSNCFIGAGSVALKDIFIEGTYFGIPARKIDF